MPMSQDDIHAEYEKTWGQLGQNAQGPQDAGYSSGVEDALIYPAYQQLLAEINLPGTGPAVLDVGCGSGRWVRFLNHTLRPRRLVGVDFTQASIDLLQKLHPPADHPTLQFVRGDITDPAWDLSEKFDLINVANVLFHIPEADRFAAALLNLRKHLAPGGRIISTEYLPRSTMRTHWMLVRSRYEWISAAAAAGLKVQAIRAVGFFCNDPMGIDGPDDGPRGRFNQVRSQIAAVLNSNLDQTAKTFFHRLFADIERAAVEYCRERIAEIDFPSQKLVVLGQ